MIVVDKLLANGIGWVLRRVADVVDAELYDESSLREELLASEMRLELGEIDEEEFRAIESKLIARMRDGRAQAEARAALEPGTRYVLAGIEADTGEDARESGRDQKPAPRKTRAAPPAARKKKRRR